MGLMARMVELQAGKTGKKDESLGQAIIVTAEAEAGNVLTPEVWSVAGVWAIPPDGSHGIYLPVGGGSFGVIVAHQNYLVDPPISVKGEGAYGSTTPDGKTIKALAIARGDGTWEINGSSKRLVTNDLVGILATFITALNASLSTAGGPPVSLDISAAITTTVKTGG